MSNSRSLLVGVVEELWVDLGDSLWLLLEAFGLGPLLTRLRQEASSASSRRRRFSVVRILGSALPLRPVERPYLRYVALRSLSTSCDSLFSSQTQGQIDPKWLADTERSRGFRPIMSRCETTPNLYSDGLALDYEDPNDNDSPRSSTPFSVVSDFGHRKHNFHSEAAIGSLHQQHHRYPHLQNSALHDSGLQHSTLHAASPFTDPMALAKINALEDELSQLRSQISLLINQTQRPLTPPSTPVPFAAPPPPPPPPPPLKLPPPPPPPPPTLPSSSTNSVNASRKTSFSDLIAQNKDSINKHSEPIEITSSSSSTGVSMADVLKGLNKVKLKKVARSPGGTPIKERAQSPVAGDPASIIAAALKKRFAKINVESPEKDIDDNNDFNSSPETTPKCKRRSGFNFVPRRLEPAKKLEPEESSPVVLDLKPLLRKPSLKHVKTGPKADEKPSLPIFGQHLLKKRSPRPAEARPVETQDRGSPSSEVSDLSR